MIEKVHDNTNSTNYVFLIHINSIILKITIIKRGLYKLPKRRMSMSTYTYAYVYISESDVYIVWWCGE